MVWVQAEIVVTLRVAFQSSVNRLEIGNVVQGSRRFPENRRRGLRDEPGVFARFIAARLQMRLN